MHAVLARRLILTLAAASAALAWSGCGSSPQNASPLPSQVTNSIVRTASGAPVLHTFTAGVTKGFLRTALVRDITAGADGAMWFTDITTPAIGKITADGQVTEYTKGLPGGAKPWSIVAGPGGNLWFSDANGAVGSVTPSGTIVEYSIDKFSKVASPAGIAAGPDGSIWTIAPGPPNLLIRVAPDGTLTATKTPSDLAPDGSLAADAAGNLWMMSLEYGKENGYMLERKANGRYVVHHTGLVHAVVFCCPNYAPKRIVIGPDGNPWFTTMFWLRPTGGGKVVGTIRPTGTTLFTVDKGTLAYPAIPSAIATGRVDVWFAGDDPFQVNGALWHIDASGAQKVFPIPHNPIGLAASSDGNLWFTAEAFNDPSQIVEAVLPR
jgi:virginiamycin B lyase